jgi:formyl-CoA transferase
VSSGVTARFRRPRRPGSTGGIEMGSEQRTRGLWKEEKGLLESLRILDLTWVLGGPYAGQLLAQLGAEVIKVESPSGDPSREIPPYFFDGDSSFFLSVNRGKSSIVIDLKTSAGLEVFYDLVRESDAVIYGYAPDVPRRLGIDYESLRKVNPRICVGQLIGLHDEGEYVRAPAYDLIVQALGGIMSINGYADRPPARVGYQIADLAGGAFLALGVCGALAGRTATEGSLVQVSLLDCQLALLTWQAQNYFISGEVPQATGPRSPMIAPSEVFAAADGAYLAVSPTGTKFWTSFCDVIGLPELADDPRYVTRIGRLENVEELARVIAERIAARPAEDWLRRFAERRVPVAPVLNVAEAVHQPLARLRNMTEAVTNPATSNSTEFLGNPFKYEKSKPLAYPPQRGQDTAEVLTSVCGYSASKIEELSRDGSIGVGR